MTVPTNIPETPIVHTDHESFQGSKGKNISISTEVLQHVLKTIMDIKDDDKVESFSHWMSYRGLQTSLIFLIHITISCIVFRNTVIRN